MNNTCSITVEGTIGAYTGEPIIIVANKNKDGKLEFTEEQIIDIVRSAYEAGKRSAYIITPINPSPNPTPNYPTYPYYPYYPYYPTITWSSNSNPNSSNSGGNNGTKN